jgi:hypothetical protein
MSAQSLEEAAVRGPERPWQRIEQAENHFQALDWGSALFGLIPRRTRKQLRKTIRKVVKRHGPELIAAVASGVLTSLLSAATGAGKKRKKKKRKD